MPDAAHRATRAMLARQARQDRELGPLIAVAAAALGVWVGLDLRGGALGDVLDRLLYLTLAASAPLPIAALGALYHDAAHAPLLVWPLSAGTHLRLGARLLALRHLPWGLLVVGLALGAGWGAPPPQRLALLAFAALTYGGAWGAAFGVAALCAGASSSEHALARRLRHDLAGPFSSERHAPFFYLPALAFALAALAATLAEAGALRLLAGRAGLAGSLLLLAAPAAVGALAVLLGARAYRRHALRAIPRVLEEARTVYGGRPAPADPPYGAGLARLLPRLVAPHYLKELREQARAHRGLWALVVLAMLVVGAYAASVGQPLAAAPFAGALLVVWAASLPARRGPRQAGAAFTATLPVAPAAAWLGRCAALLFVGGHVAAAVAATLGYRHGRGAAVAALALLVATATATVTATTTRATRATALLLRPRWGAAARLVPAAALAAALLATRALLVGLAALAALVLATLAARRLGRAGGAR